MCIYSKFVKLAKEILSQKKLKIATVVNFPSGDDKISKILNEIENTLNDGTDEIDLVIPYKEYIVDGFSRNTKRIVKNCKNICGSKLLKVIIESGKLKRRDLIEKC